MTPTELKESALYLTIANVQAVSATYAADTNRPLGLLDDYQPSLKEVLGHEGGYTNDPQDPGGPTNWGITIFDARMYWKPTATADDVRAMDLDVAKGIYKNKYWNAVRGDDLPAGLDYCVFDYAVNSGRGRAVPVLQRMIGVKADGVMGPETMKALAAATDTQYKLVALIGAYQNERLLFLKGLKTWGRFGKGWATRVQDVRRDAIAMVTGAARGEFKVVPIKPVPQDRLPPPIIVHPDGAPVKVPPVQRPVPPGTPAGPAVQVPHQPTGWLGLLGTIFRALFGK